MNNLIKSFNKRFNNFFADLYHYEPLDFNASTSVYDFKKDDFVDKVSAGIIGDHSLIAAEDYGRFRIHERLYK